MCDKTKNLFYQYIQNSNVTSFEFKNSKIHFTCNCNEQCINTYYQLLPIVKRWHIL